MRRHAAAAAIIMFVALEGIVGAGKSTVLNLLDKASFSVCYEPVESFQSPVFEGKNLLALAYQKPHQYAFLSQLNILLKLAKHFHQIKFISSSVITERSCLSPLVFIEAYRKCSYITDPEYFILKELYEYLFGDLILPHLVLFLDTPLPLSKKRIVSRNREGEVNTDLKFYSAVRDSYVSLIQRIQQKTQSKVVVIPECVCMSSPSEVALFIDNILKEANFDQNNTQLVADFIKS